MYLTLILLTWRIWWAPNNASKWQMEFNSAFKGLSTREIREVAKNAFWKHVYHLGIVRAIRNMAMQKPEPLTCLTNKNTFSNQVLLILFCLLCVVCKGEWTVVYAHQKISSGERVDEFWWNLVRILYYLKPLHSLYSLTATYPWEKVTWTTDELVRWKRH